MSENQGFLLRIDEPGDRVCQVQFLLPSSKLSDKPRSGLGSVRFSRRNNSQGFGGKGISFQVTCNQGVYRGYILEYTLLGIKIRIKCDKFYNNVGLNCFPGGIRLRIHSKQENNKKQL